MLSLKLRSRFVAPLLALSMAAPALGQANGTAGVPDRPQGPGAALPPSAPPGEAGGEPAPSAGLSDAGQIVRIKSLVDSARYEDCVELLDVLLEGPVSQRLSQPDALEQARLYHATCLLSTRQSKRAEDALSDALEANPTMLEPDPYEFGDEVLELFLQVRNERSRLLRDMQVEKLRAAKDRERRRRRALKRLEALAETETIVVENSRWTAAIPFGVGQFQNRDPALGWLFLVSEVLTLGTSLTALTVRTHLQVEQSEASGSQAAQLREATERIRDWTTVLEISSWSFLALAAGGIAHAQLTFEPKFVEKRKRPLPPELRLSESVEGLESSWIVPTLAPTPDGFSVGVRGVF